jgi:hypothetical protein
MNAPQEYAAEGMKDYALRLTEILGLEDALRVIGGCYVDLIEALWGSRTAAETLRALADIVDERTFPGAGAEPGDRQRIIDLMRVFAAHADDPAMRAAAARAEGGAPGRPAIDDDRLLAFCGRLLDGGLVDSIHGAAERASKLYASPGSIDATRDRLKRKLYKIQTDSAGKNINSPSRNN